MPFFVLWNNREKEVMIIRYVSYALPNTVLALICEGLIEREVIFDKSWVDQGYALNYAADRLNVYSGAFIFLAISAFCCAIGIYMDVWNTGKRVEDGDVVYLFQRIVVTLHFRIEMIASCHRAPNRLV